MILDSGENCVRSVLWHFRWFFRSCWATLARALSVPGRSLVLGCQKLHCRGLRTSVRSAQMCIFCDFSHIFCLFFRGGSNMVAFRAKVDGTWQAKFQRRLRYRVAGLRPSGLPNLPFSLSLPFPPSSSNSFPFPNVFFNFSSFHPFPSSLPFFSPFFPQFTSNFPSLPFTLFPAFSGQSDASPCDPFVSNVHHEARDTEANATCCESAFCIILGIFWAPSKKEGPIW